MPYPKGKPRSEESKRKIGIATAKRHYRRRAEIEAAGEMECRICLETKPLAAFVRDRGRELGYVRACRDCHRGLTKRWRDKNIEQARETERQGVRRRRYAQLGITEEEYQALLVRQGSVCAICKGAMVGKRLAVDHCHGSSRIRGLLCIQCNQGLGYFKDDPGRLRRAADYLDASPN